MGRVYRKKLSIEAHAYFAANSKRWAHGMQETRKLELHRFDQWLDARGLKLSDLDTESLVRYCDQPLDSTPAGPKLKFIRDFLIWCQNNGFSTPDTRQCFRHHLRIPEFPFPPESERYFAENSTIWKPRTHVDFRRAVALLHQWMGRQRIGLRDLDRPLLEKFFEHVALEKNRGKATIHHLKITIRNYLDWLAANNTIPEIDTTGLIMPGRFRFLRRISPSAREYLRVLSAIVKPRTLAHIQTTLGNFYSFLHDSSLSQDQLSRRVLEDWLLSMKTKGYSPSTRISYIRWLRRYFFWIHEHGQLSQNPDRLLLLTDYPKRPRYLPRPIPTDIDQEIQRRLQNSDGHLFRAVLLLRKTGIRVNELWSLPSNCVQQDPSGTSYLKVPLGKMNNERLVPLDAQTCELITKIRDQANALRQEVESALNGSEKLVYGQAHPASFCSDVRDAFREVTRGLITPEPLHIHRLRHTFATEMLNAGMSLFGVMRLLGHRHAGTTLIYAAITQPTVRGEFFAAIEKLKTKYKTTNGWRSDSVQDLSPVAIVDDLARSLRRVRGIGKPAENTQIQRLLKRLSHIRKELKDLS